MVKGAVTVGERFRIKINPYVVIPEGGGLCARTIQGEKWGKESKKKK